MADLYPDESNLTRFMHRHTLFNINPIAIHDLPPPLPPFLIPPTDDTVSETSSRAGSVAPSEDDKRKIDRFGRPIRERTNSPNPQTIKKKNPKRELPSAIMEFLAVLPPANVFDGATFHIDELVKLIRNAKVPYPAGFVMNGKRTRDDEDSMLGTMKRSR
jgi:hypothetical protein